MGHQPQIVPDEFFPRRAVSRPQRGEGLVNNAMFILYAPYGDNPEIAIAIAVEKGGAGATLSPVARKIVDYYFTFQSSANTVENAYSLLK